MTRIYERDAIPMPPSNLDAQELIRHIENSYPDLKAGLKLLFERFKEIVGNEGIVESKAEEIEGFEYECPHCGTVLQIDLELE